MLQLTDIQTLVAGLLFGGNETIAGLAMFAVMMGAVFLLIRNVVASLLIALPLIMIASNLGILSGDMMILLIIITVLGLGLSARSILAG